MKALSTETRSSTLHIVVGAARLAKRSDEKLGTLCAVLLLCLTMTTRLNPYQHTGDSSKPRLLVNPYNPYQATRNSSALFSNNPYRLGMIC